MLSSQKYLVEKVQPCIQEIFDHFLPKENFKSIHDLFNADKFYKFLICVLNEQTKAKVHDLELYQNKESNETYYQVRIKQFENIYQMIENSYFMLGLNFRKKISWNQIESMVQQNNFKTLNYFLEYIFQLLKHNNEIVEFITTLSQQIQNSIMQIMQRGQSGDCFSFMSDAKISQKSINSLKLNSKLQKNQQGEHISSIQQIEELETHLQQKQEQLKQARVQKQILQKQIQDLKLQHSQQDQQIQILKKHLLTYEQIDQLLIQKDQQINKLTTRLSELQLKSRLKQSQLSAQVRILNEKILTLQNKDIEVLTKYEKLKQNYQISQKQKLQSQTTLKKVINNLKDKIKIQTQKITQMNKQIIQVNYMKGLIQSQLIRLKNQQQIYNNKNLSQAKTLQNINSPRSPLRGNDDFLEGIQSVRGNYSKLGEQLSLDLDKSEFEEDLAMISNKPTSSQKNRFTQLLQQNYSLKTQLQSSLHQLKQSKQLHNQITKLNKKIIILKRRNDELDNQHKDEMDILIGVMEQFYVSTNSGHGTNHHHLNNNNNSMNSNSMVNRK